MSEFKVSEHLNTDNLRIAKKMYKCSHCSRAISPGEPYRRSYVHGAKKRRTLVCDCVLCVAENQTHEMRDTADALESWVENNR